jgi:hypothetical protein
MFSALPVCIFFMIRNKKILLKCSGCYVVVDTSDREMVRQKEVYRRELEARRERRHLEKEKERTLREIAKKRERSRSRERKKRRIEEEGDETRGNTERSGK